MVDCFLIWNVTCALRVQWSGFKTMDLFQCNALRLAGQTSSKTFQMFIKAWGKQNENKTAVNRIFFPFEVMNNYCKQIMYNKGIKLVYSRSIW